MISTTLMSARAILRYRNLTLVFAAIVPILLLGGFYAMGTAQTAGANQCVACHTDAAKLKALTPPDPPPTEAGEG
jgi:mono/diheme cytochrome c family protein